MTLFSEEEIRQAEDEAKRLVESPMGRAAHLHNALQAFIEDVGRNVGATPIRTCRCIDVSEIYAWVSPGKGHADAASFGGLLELAESSDLIAKRDHNFYITSLDRLALQQVLFSNTEKYGITEAHALEYNNVKDRLQHEMSSLITDIFNEGEAFFKNINLGQITRLIDYLKETKSKYEPDDLELAKAINHFRVDFIPHIQAVLIKTYTKNRETEERFLDFEHKSRLNGRLVQVGFAIGPTLLEAFRSWGNIKNGINQNEIINFLNDSDTKQEFAEVREAVIRLAEKASMVTLQHKSGKKKDDVSVPNARRRSIRTDATALAILHTFNTFLRRRNYGLQLDLLSRSPTMHTVIAALPSNKLRLTIRHPLFLPEIYSFSESALAELRSLGSKIEGFVRPWRESRIPKPDESQISANLDAVRVLGIDIVRTLGDAAVVQTIVTAEGEAMLKDSEQKNKSNKGRRRKDEESLSVDEALNVCVLFEQAMRERDSPLSTSLISGLSDRTNMLVESERRQLEFKRRQLPDKETKRSVRYISITYVKSSATDEDSHHKALLFRFTDGHLTRSFQLYGEAAIHKILPNGLETRHSANNHLEYWIDTLDLMADWLESRRSKSKQRQPDLDQVEGTLICAVALAVEGRFSASAAVVSPVLDTVTRMLRKLERNGNANVSLFNDQLDPLYPLAFKELFLLRQYCERATALEYLTGRPQDAFDIGGERSFARAQRDLSYAFMMTENASAIARTRQASMKGSNATVFEVSESAELDSGTDTQLFSTIPAGVDSHNDCRLPMIGFAGWLDQFLFLQIWAVDKFQETVEPSPLLGDAYKRLRRRHDIWLAAAMIKGQEILAYRLSKLCEEQRKQQEKGEGFTDYISMERYYAYSEARALSGLCMSLLVFLAFDISPEVQSLWNPRIELGPDKLLVFRGHREWFNKFRKLCSSYKFEIRTLDLFEDVSTALNAIDDLRSRFREVKPKQLDKRESILVECTNIMTDLSKKLEARNIGNNKTTEAAGKYDNSPIPENRFLGSLVKYLCLRINQISERL